MQEGTFTAPGYSGETARPAPNVYAADCPTRLLLDRIADKWSVLILTTLGPGERRFNGLKRHIDGISQKMLSQTLRSLERDGLVQRDVVPTVPVSVTYAVTPLGRELLDALQAMIDWAERRMGTVASAQVAYDRREEELSLIA
ncbi:winged helix-turn-helix transcriptional regulator [Novosphingobium guangzhouense]|uniref:HxlR family transcriptional regulator n=1 Tax=Novosphingobium guangzhouense TaxID=1850347 RepID=A0A2K2G6F9_9SPHN|nr:helix-turn-helix domain-containing protein [Novosphingobium guangzhouense]PNU06609.1 HxlR family transcriptional regulator [Novosphingobium guangzhouense]